MNEHMLEMIKLSWLHGLMEDYWIANQKNDFGWSYGWAIMERCEVWNQSRRHYLHHFKNYNFYRSVTFGISI